MAAINYDGVRTLLKIELAENRRMDTGFLDRVADQLKVNKTAACCRAINRIFRLLRRPWEGGSVHRRLPPKAASRTHLQPSNFSQNRFGPPNTP